MVVEVVRRVDLVDIEIVAEVVGLVVVVLGYVR